MGGITDFVEEGVTGWLFSPGDVSALTQIIAERIRAGRAALPLEMAFNRFRAATTPQHVAARYEHVYDETINSQKLHPGQ
jgi:glycosyltransferase involved in cell wall biosynthesis